MPPRFYLDEPLDRPTATLAGAEAHHLTNVLRASPGDRVVLFDGRGTEALAEVAAVGRRTVELNILDRRTTLDRRRPVILGTAVPKGDRFRWLVEKAAELGVARLVPLRTERAVVDPAAGKLDKLRQTVIAACKQCGINRLMAIEAVTPWGQFVDREISGRRTLIGVPGGPPFATELLAGSGDDPLVLAIGPEGDFTPSEVQQALDAGAQPVSLGPNLLRVETAGIALAALALILQS
ncbi:MAG TPA: RsmE family RNA methyltransferase [Planctomycetaceae bacterium]|nr:RsmE family RNA methyltransferase [Planctomycetaceae bacterium]